MESKGLVVHTRIPGSSRILMAGFDLYQFGSAVCVLSETLLVLSEMVLVLVIESNL